MSYLMKMVVVVTWIYELLLSKAEIYEVSHTSTSILAPVPNRYRLVGYCAEDELMANTNDNR